MLKLCLRQMIICLLSFTLIACATPRLTAQTMSELRQGKRDFDGGFYKRAMRELLPIACNGIPDAQYAIGYMYYYGYGVAQDNDVGFFWINRAANKGFGPAIAARDLILKNEADGFQLKNTDS